MNKIILYIITAVVLVLGIFACTESPDGLGSNPPYPERSFYLWVDATANLERLANDVDSIDKYVIKAKEVGFTDLVVDVRTISGEVMYKSNIASQLKSWKGVERTATFDYLGEFVKSARKHGMRIYASMNTFSGGHLYSPFWEESQRGERDVPATQHPEWVSENYTWNGTSAIIESMWDMYGGKNSKTTAFLNPVNDEVQSYILSIINEITANYEIDGVILDRARFDGIEADFSELTRARFEAYIGESVTNWPNDIYELTGANEKKEGIWYNKWLEFRASVIYNFIKQASVLVKNNNKKIGTYVGAWYATYYNEGVNWASRTYDPSLTYSWATVDYKNYAYAEELDFIITGCYSSTESGVKTYATLSQKVINGAIPHAAGLYMEDYNAVEKTKLNAGKEAYQKCLISARKEAGNIMIFDMVQLNNDLYNSTSSRKYWDITEYVLK